MENDIKKAVTIICIILFGLMIMLPAGDSDDSYARTLESGRTKYLTGQPMTKEEYNAVKSYNSWKSNQGTKTYNQWGN